MELDLLAKLCAHKEDSDRFWHGLSSPDTRVLQLNLTSLARFLSFRFLHFIIVEIENENDQKTKQATAIDRVFFMFSIQIHHSQLAK